MASDKLDIVRKLLAKAEGASTPEEAEIYTGKAMELMARHGIDEALVAAKGKTREQIVMRRITIDQPYSSAKASLVSWVATALGAKAVLHNARGGRTVTAVSILGFESDLNRIEMLYTSLLLQATGQVINQYPHEYWSPSPQTVAAHRRAWITGFAAAVHFRLKATYEQATAAAQAEQPASLGTPGVALVLADRSAQVEAAYKDAFTNVRSTRQRGSNGSGYSAGHAAGQRADLGQSSVVNRRQAIGG